MFTTALLINTGQRANWAGFDKTHQEASRARCQVRTTHGTLSQDVQGAFRRPSDDMGR